MSHRQPVARSCALVSNADDWGRDPDTTDRTLRCVARGSVTAVSAMVFMADSDRAALMARDRDIDVGLHLNLSTEFSGRRVPATLREHQARVWAHLSRHRLAPVVFHPGLRNSFEYLVKGQLDEFARLYGRAPHRIDGHHHLHLCANVVLANLLPSGGVVRRNLSFRRGEKSAVNRGYRALVDWRLARRHCLVDFVFALPPVDATHLRRMCGLATRAVVEMEVHSIRDDEYCFLMSGGLFGWVDASSVRPFRSLFESAGLSGHRLADPTRADRSQP